MKRSHFIKNLFSGAIAIFTVPQFLIAETPKDEYIIKFEDLFIIHKGNDILIYPKKECIFYKKIIKDCEDRINPTGTLTYMPVHHLSIPIKESYKFEDLLPIKYYFESVYGKSNNYTSEMYGTCFRLIKDGIDRMHLEVFVSYK